MLDEIYLYNVEARGIVEADRFLTFLKGEIDRLDVGYNRGEPLQSRPGLRCTLVKKRSGGDGHVVVFKVDEGGGTVDIQFVFPTKQDWQNYLWKPCEQLRIGSFAQS